MRLKTLKPYFVLSPLFILSIALSFFYQVFNAEYKLHKVYTHYSEKAFYYSLPKGYVPFQKYKMLVALYPEKDFSLCLKWQKFASNKKKILLCLPNESDSQTSAPQLLHSQTIPKIIQIFHKKYKTYNQTLIGFRQEANKALKVGLENPLLIQNILIFYQPEVLAISPTSLSKPQKVLLIGNQSFFSKRRTSNTFNELKRGKYKVRAWLYPYTQIQFPSYFNQEMNKAFDWFYGRNVANRQDILDLL